MIKKDVKNSNMSNEKIMEEINNLKHQISILQKNLNVNVNYKKISNEKVRIAVLFQVPSFWPSLESIYNTLKKDERFILKFYLIDLPEKEPSQMKGAKQFLKDNNIDYDILSLNKLKMFDPHAAIIQTPYDEWHRTPEFYSSELKKLGIRLIYISYGIEFSAEQESLKLQFSTNFINNMWRIYTLSSSIQKNYCIFSRLTLDNVKVLGHPKFDGLYNKSCFTNYNFKKLAKGKKIVLVKIHFPKIFNQGILDEITTPSALVYVELLNNLNKFKDCYFIFMYHPKMFDSKELPGVADLEQLLQSKKYSNMITFEEEDYREPLYSADMFICDRSSVAIEMAFFNKPILYLENDKYKEEYLPEFSELFESYIKGETYNDIKKFIKMSSIGIDKNKKIRCERFKKIVKYSDGKASERIVNDIYNGVVNNIN